MNEDPEFMRRLGEILDRAIDLPAPARAAFLEHACDGDQEMRERVDELLALDAQREGFMDDPTIEKQPAESDAGALHGVCFGPYKVLEKIGEGGYGEVYLAEQREPVTRRVALKIIKPGMDTKQVIARFESERQALAMMEHANIARVLDAGATTNGRPYFIMELVRGVPITDFCNEAHWGIEARLQLFLDVCTAVQHAHQKGIIHRDLKPSNILVTMDGDQPVPKIIDFGIAKATGQKLTEHTVFTQFHQFIGTPAYMSPEQAQFSNQDVDTRADIYALGVLLYELLTGHTPHDTQELLTKGQEAVFRAIREDDPVKPSTRLTEARKRERHRVAHHLSHSEIPRELDWVVMKALEKDRKRRYETAIAFASDVRHFLRGEAVEAAPPSRMYRLGKLARRHRTVAFAAAGILSALVLGLSFAWMAYREERAARLISAKALYASDMKVAQTALELGDFELVRTKLEAHIPEGDEEDLRGWIWRYLFGKAHPGGRMSSRIPSVKAIAVSPSGDVAVAGWRADERPIEQLHGNTLELESLLGHSLVNARSMAFSPDGRHLTVEQPTAISILDIENKLERIVQRAGASPLRPTPDGRHLVGLLQRQDQTKPIMRVASYRIDQEAPLTLSDRHYVLADRYGWYREFRISPDGGNVTVCTANRMVHVLSLPDLEGLQSIAVTGMVSAVAWSPDARWLATGYTDSHAVDLWDVAEGVRAKRLESFLTTPCHDLKFSPNGAFLAGIDTAGFLHLRELEMDHSRTIHTGFQVKQVAFYPNNEALIAAGVKKVARFAVAAVKPSALEIDALQHRFWNLDYSTDGSLLAAASADGIVRLYDAKTHDLVKELGEGNMKGRLHLKPTDSNVCFTRDGRRVFADTGESTATLFDVISGEPLTQFSLSKERTLQDISMSADGEWLGIAGDRLLAIKRPEDVRPAWARDRDIFRASNLGAQPSALLITFSPDPGSPFVAIGAEKKIVVRRIGSWERMSGASLTPLQSLDFSPDGTVLGAGGIDRARLYHVPALTVIDEVGGSGGAVSNISFTDNSQTVAVAYQNGHVQIYSRRVQAETGRLSEDSQVVCARFSPDGNELAIATLGAGVRFFRAPSMQEVLAIQEQEKAAREVSQRLSDEAKETARRERQQRYASDPGAIKEWLWLGAIPYSPNTEAPEAKAALDASQIADESAMKPREGETVTIDGRRFTWQPLRPDDYFLDFQKLFPPADLRKSRFIYACCYVRAERAMNDLHIRTGSDDLAKIYLNGAEIFKNDRGWIGRDLDVVKGVSLREGVNTLIFKIVNSSGVGNGSLRFTTADGGPVDGISVSLEP